MPPRHGRVGPDGRRGAACLCTVSRGDSVADSSGYQRTGRIVNHGTWMIVGPAFEPHKLGQYGDTDPPYDPLNDPTRGHGPREGETFGNAPGGGLPRAIGHEWDLTVATLARMTRHTPAGAPLPRPPDGIEVIAKGMRQVPGKLDAYLDYYTNITESLNGLSAEMIYWERPRGGRVFHAGAVGAAWVVGSDPVFGQLLRNVLHHFGVPQPAAIAA